MYNAEIKQKFMDTIAENSAYQYSGYFRRTENAEMTLGKDISAFTESEIRSCIQEWDLTMYGSCVGFLSCMRRYSAWCRAMGFPSCDGFKHIGIADFNISDTVGNLLFRDDTELFSEIRRVIPLDNGLVEPAALAIAWLGLSKDEAVALQMSDVDLDSQAIRVDGVSITERFSAAAWSVIRDYASCDEAEAFLGSIPYTVYRDNTPMFLARFYARDSVKVRRPVTKPSLEAAIGKLNRKYKDLGFPDRMSYTNVWFSGRLYALWNAEKAGRNLNDRESVEAVFRKRKSYTHIIWEYDNYKRAYGLSV